LSASFELTSLPGWAIVRSLLNDLRSQGALFEAFVARELGTLQSIRVALDERHAEVERQQTALAAERRQLDDRWQQLDALRETVEQGAKRVQDDARRLAAAQAELAAAAGVLEQQGVDPNIVLSPRPERAVGLNDELAALRSELHQTRSQMVGSAGLAPELRTARREIDKLRRRLMRQNARLAQATSQADARLTQQFQQMRDERNQLAAELAALQDRAAQLAGQVETERQQIAGERKGWLGELRRVRTSVESQLRGAGPPSSALSVMAEPRVPAESLDTILAQFETLQQEIAERLRPAAAIPASFPDVSMQQAIPPREEFTC
jgi:predicted  nucleic acid-binding Zn-ribbon protein